MVVTIFTETMENEIGTESGASPFLRLHWRFPLTLIQGAHDLLPLLSTCVFGLLEERFDGSDGLGKRIGWDAAGIAAAQHGQPCEHGFDLRAE